MAKKSNPGSAYYYANDQKVELIPADDLFVVDSDTPNIAPASRQVGRPLTGGLLLCKKNEIGEVAQGLSKQKPKYPTFRLHGAVVVALPEVRVEESRASHRGKLDRWLREHSADVTVVSRDDDRVVLKPVSGSGLDALTIANGLTEEVGPELAQTHFIRVTPRPKTGSA